VQEPKLPIPVFPAGADAEVAAGSVTEFGVAVTEGVAVMEGAAPFPVPGTTFPWLSTDATLAKFCCH
jgi:hypothetical protein